MTHRTAVVALVVAQALLLRPIASRAAEATGAPGLTVHVIDKATKAPISGAKLNVSLAGREIEQTTNADGSSRVALRVQDPANFMVIVTAPGYVPRRVYWGAYRIGQGLPESFTFALEPGITIGGVVKDKAGNPVEGEELSLTTFGADAMTRGADAAFLTDRRVTSGPDGAWRCDGVPPDFTSMTISFVRPQSVAYTSQLLGLPNGTIDPSTDASMLDRLRDHTAELVVPERVRVPVTVVGPDEKPVAGAKLLHDAKTVTAETDAEGEATVDAPAAGFFGFVLQAPGFAREFVRKEAVAGQDPQPIRVKLRPARSVRGRVVDMQGNPVEGARILGMSEATTDADGRFTCADVPDGPGSFTIFAEGFLQLGNHPLTPGDREHVVRLLRPTRVSGTVVDAETGEPIPSFTVIPGAQVAAGQPVYLTRHMGGTFTGGKFEGNVHEEWYGRSVEKRFVRVEADGYVPAVSPTIPGEQETLAHDFKLVRGAGPSGVVLDPDRNPLAGVKVYVSTPEGVVYVSDGKVSEHSEFPSVTSDADGKFTLPAQIGPYAAVVAHDAGFIMKTPEQLKGNPQMLLMPWGRLEGVVKIGGKPAAGETMELDYRSPYYPDKATVYFAAEPVKTDAEGRYAFERVGPAPAKLGRRMRNENPNVAARNRPTHQENVDARPGQTVTINIGGTGVPLVGRVKPPAALADGAAGWTYSDLSELRLALPPMPVPDNFNEMSEEEQSNWVRAHLESPEGKKIDRASFKRMRYPVEVRPDGSFKVDDLPPGFYSLRLRALDAAKGSANSLGEEVAKATKQFVIPENFAGGRFDVGELTAEPLYNLPVGKVVPNFTVKTLDGGRPLKLSDYRGKVVLLDFWASWCGPCLFDTPALKSVHEAFGKDDRFVLVSLSLDPDAAAAIEYAKKNDLGWVHGFLGEWSKTQLPDQFGVRGIPAYFLIGPDGALLTRDLSGNNLKREVEAALQRLPAKKE